MLLLTWATLPNVAAAANVDATWNGGAGNWNTAANWSGNVVPNNGGGSTFSAFIDGGNATNSVVTLDTNPTITNLSIDNGDQLIEGNGQTFVLTSGTLTNNGTFSINSTGANTDLYCSDAAVLSGAGSIVMSDAANNRLLTNNTVCTNAMGHTIRGAGQLLVNTGGMQNAGSVIADKPTTLTIDPNGLNVTNTGTLEAQKGATLRLQSGTFLNTGGRIEALDASTVAVTNASVAAGTLTTAGSGSISVESGTFADITNNGATMHANGQAGAITGTLTDNGTWSLNSLGANTDLMCLGGATISGPGSIVMSNNTNNRILTDNTVCTHAAGHTIHGAGQLLVNTGGMQNAGTIIADQAAGLLIDPNGLNFTNTGKLQAKGGATLTLTAGVFVNTNGLVEALDTSMVAVAGATVINGTVTTDGSGLISVGGGSVFTNVTNSGAVVQVNGQAGSVTGTLTNNGTWSLNSTGANTDLTCAGNAVLAGNGSLRMGDHPNNRLLTDNTVCTNGLGHTIRGAGQLLVNTGGMINKGTVLADLPSGLTIDPNGLGFTNAASLQAGSGGTLTLSNGPFDNSNGVIEAMNNSLVLMSGATVTGGQITSDGTGVVRLASSMLAGVTSTAAIQQANGSPATITGTIVNDGTWSLNSTGADTDLDCSGATLAGMGSLVMSNNGNNRLLTDNNVCTNSAGHTIRGAGQLLVNTGGMQNMGTIIADQTASLTIDPNGLNFTNTGTLKAMSGGTLLLQSGTFVNANGLVEALDMSLVRFNGATLTNGTMTTSGSGTISVEGSTFTNVTNDGVAVEANGQPSAITGTLTNNGTWMLNSTGANTDLTCVSGAALSGTGSIVMSNNGNNRILTNNDRCVNAAGHTIRGAGQLLVNTGGMLNQGTIIADQVTGLTIDPNGIGFTNEGVLRAMGSGGITIDPDAFTNAGTVLVDAGSFLSRNGVYPQTAGTTTVNGTLSATGLVDIQGRALRGAGTVAANVSNAGQVDPGTGTSAGLLTISGTYAQATGGALNIEIGGLTAGTDYDRLAVSGAATLAGTINISLANNFRPTLGSMFTILSFAAGHAGDFATYNGLTQSNGVVFSKMYTPTGLVLTVISEAFTPTPTTTGMLTQTPTPTITPTEAATLTPTLTAAATATSTATRTPSSTPTESRTSTPTPTPTGVSTGTPTPTATTSPTDTPALTPTSTQTQTATATSSPPPPSPTVTPTGTTTPNMVALVGFVLSPGIGGFPGTHGQVPLGDVPVSLFLCELRMPCLGTGTPVTTTFTEPDGRFVLVVAADLLENKLRIVVARISPTVTLRAPVVVLPAGGASSQARRVARQVGGPTDTLIDAISEAAVRLLEEQGLENYDNNGVAAVVQAVEVANADANFENLTTEQAVDAATTTAASDPTVQMALQDNQFTPTPTVTPTPGSCVGDCDGSGEVTVDEVIKGVNIALDNAALGTCPQFDVDGNGMVTVNELIIAVNNVLNGCH